MSFEMLFMLVTRGIAVRIVPLTLKEANDFIAQQHRHHKPVVGHRFSVGARDLTGNLVGVAVGSRPT